MFDLAAQLHHWTPAEVREMDLPALAAALGVHRPSDDDGPPVSSDGDPSLPPPGTAERMLVEMQRAEARGEDPLAVR